MSAQIFEMWGGRELAYLRFTRLVYFFLQEPHLKGLLSLAVIEMLREPERG
jgi:hypothetical protein